MDVSLRDGPSGECTHSDYVQVIVVLSSGYTGFSGIGMVPDTANVGVMQKAGRRAPRFFIYAALAFGCVPFPFFEPPINNLTPAVIQLVLHDLVYAIPRRQCCGRLDHGSHVPDCIEPGIPRTPSTDLDRVPLAGLQDSAKLSALS